MQNNEQPFKQKNEKTSQWNETKKKIEEITDGLGLEIDKNIQEAITGLSLFDIHTTGSCEGHLDHGTFAPYIDVEAKEAKEKEKEYLVAKNKNEKVDWLIAEIIKANLLEQKKLVHLLDEFYTARQTPFYKRLIIQTDAWGESRLESQGAALQDIEDDDIRRARLFEYQEEMSTFSNFLKKKFFNSD